MRRAEGWWWRGPALVAVLFGIGVALVPVGWVLAHVSDAIGGAH